MSRYLLAAVVVSVLLTPLASATVAAPPPIRVDYSGPTEATSAAGASVTYNVKAFDPVSGNPISASCDPGGSGSGDFDVTASYPIGATSVVCTATLEDASTASKTITVTVQDTTAPSVSVPSNITTSTTNASGTTVSWQDADVSATDIVDGSVSTTCSPQSGSTFVVGATTVTCTATDSHGNTGSAAFTVTVTLIDDQAPTVTVPDSTTVEATGPGGAVVTYTASASDNADPSPTIACNPSSGSAFPLGTTHVSCTATDASGNTSPPATFDITVSDTTAPTLAVPGDQTVEATDPGGATVTYTATASDLVAGAISPSCNPASGATFPLGATTVTCSANDGHGNTAQASFTVTVVDRTAPVLSSIPSNRTVEANGPGGSVVNFTTPTATDSLDGPIAFVTCAPSSGSTFPLGTTTVTCSATDAHGNAGTATFSVSVVDTTAPSLVVPSDRAVYADTPDGISAQSHDAAVFLSEANAVDSVDPHPSLRNDAPGFFAVGTHVVTFTASDASGNAVSKTAVLEVRPMPPPGTPPLPTPPARQTPPDVRGLKAEAGDARVRLSWQIPNGVDHVEISRSLTVGGDDQIVYTGSAEAYTDRGVANGLEYRYVVVSVDRNGDTSAGVAVVAVPKRSLLRSPKDGARLRKPPKLVWVRNSEASYYNVQLFRGNAKILSTWPVRASLVLKSSWKYERRAYRLTPGVYRWYVWPGFGARAAVDYGEMLGFSSFQIVR